jgi:hypothetical protein
VKNDAVRSQTDNNLIIKITPTLIATFPELSSSGSGLSGMTREDYYFGKVRFSVIGVCVSCGVLGIWKRL